MNWMSKYDKWYEQEKRTIQSRGIILERDQMAVEGIVEVINYRAVIDDGRNDDERMSSLIRQGLGEQNLFASGALSIAYVVERTKAVLVETALRSVTGRPVRIYSGIVFINEYAMNLYILRRPSLYPECNTFMRLSN